MTSTPGIYSCHLCEDRLFSDIPSLTEHFAFLHLEGFYILRCPRCDQKFATFSWASSHLDVCNAPGIEEWPLSYKVNYSKVHEHLNNLVNEAIKKMLEPQTSQIEKEAALVPTASEQENQPVVVTISTESAAPKTDIEPVLLPPASLEKNQPVAVTAGLDSTADEIEYDEEVYVCIDEVGDDESFVEMNEKEPVKTNQGDEELNTESPTPTKVRKRRLDAISEDNYRQLLVEKSSNICSNCLGSSLKYGNVPVEIQIPVMPHMYNIKNIDLMGTPLLRTPVANYAAPTFAQSTSSNWYFPQFGPSKVNFYPSKLVGPMKISNMCPFNKKMNEDDVTIEIQNISGVRRMFISKQILLYCSPFFKKLVSSPEYQKDPVIRLDCPFPSFLDCMNIIYSRPIPWTFQCRGYFSILNIHRIVHLLRTADYLQLRFVRAFVSKEIFSQRCGMFNPSDCVGCIERVAVALHFGIKIPEDLAFSTWASLTWLKDCQQYSCAPELHVVDAVTEFLKPSARKVLF